jgi:hypothetical protein
MSSNSRKLFLLIYGLPLLLVFPIAFLGASVFRAGTISVEVIAKHPDGTELTCRIPAALVPIAVQLTPCEVLHEVRREIQREMPEALDIARAAVRELARCPDGVFLEVQDKEDFVTIEKKDAKLSVFVDTPDETVRLELPFHTVSSVLSAI